MNIINNNSFSFGSFKFDDSSSSRASHHDPHQAKIDQLYAKFKSNNNSVVGQRPMNRLDSTHFRASNSAPHYDNFNSFKSHLLNKFEEKFQEPVLVRLMDGWENPEDMLTSTLLRFEKPSKKAVIDTPKIHFKAADTIEEWISHLMTGGETLFRSDEGEIIAPRSQAQALPEKIKIYDHKAEKPTVVTPKEILVVDDEAFHFIKDEVVTFIEVQLIKRELSENSAVAEKPKEVTHERNRRKTETNDGKDSKIGSNEKTQSQQLLEEEIKAKRKQQSANQAEENVKKLRDEKEFKV